MTSVPAFVAGQLAAIRLGIALPEAAGGVELRRALIVMTVGLRFLRFAKGLPHPNSRGARRLMALRGGDSAGCGSRAQRRFRPWSPASRCWSSSLPMPGAPGRAGGDA